MMGTVLLVCAAMGSVAAWIAALCHEKGIRPFAGAVRFVRRLPWGGRLALLPLFLALVAYGGSKYVGEGQGEGQGVVVGVGGESGFGRVERVDRVDGGESDYLAQSPQSSQSGDSDNVANVEMFPITNTNSQLETGTGNWQHSHTGNIQQGNIHTLATLTTYSSQLTTPHASLFWHAETPSNTLLLTWCNALLNRDTNSPVNIQAELFPSGGMRITHDLSGELVTEHVPAPELPCADTLDEVLARIEGGNSNAYFFADVAVARGPAVVKVKSGRETTLGDYSFVAHSGVTNRLPFLIGPEYEVKSEAAYSHFSVTNIEVAVSNLTDRLAAVQWPVKIDFGEGYDFGGGKLFEVAVDPPFLDGIMEFDGNANGGMRMLPRSGGGCGCVVSVTNGAVTVTGVCSNDTCVHEGSYVYEGYRERIELECGMDSDEDPEPESDDPSSPEEENEPSASVWFEEQAVIFEDEYENAPGETVPRRSTRTTLRCTAYGGERGGNLTVDLSGMDALRLVSGTPPSGRTLAPGEYVEFEAEYEGEKASSQENGTVAKVSFTENETNITFDDEDKMTVVKVEVSPVNQFPSGYPNRHVFGVCEKFECIVTPNDVDITWGNIGDIIWNEESNARRIGIMPAYSSGMVLGLAVKGNTFDINLTSVAPIGIDVKLVSVLSVSGIKGMAGDIGMSLKFSLIPDNVSFADLRISEEPSSQGIHTGYFSDPSWSGKWYHTQENGAGVWNTVDDESNYYATDRAYIGGCPGPWSSGTLSWEIPNVWLPPIGRGGENVPFKTTFKVVWQTMSITPDGTVSISKHGHTVSRSTNDTITINGVVWQ